MILNNIKKTIGGDDFISLPVALGCDFKQVICELDDPVFVSPEIKRKKDYFLSYARPNQSFYLRIIVGAYEAELVDKETNIINFRFKY